MTNTETHTARDAYAKGYAASRRTTTGDMDAAESRYLRRYGHTHVAAWVAGWSDHASDAPYSAPVDTTERETAVTDVVSAHHSAGRPADTVRAELHSLVTDTEGRAMVDTAVSAAYGDDSSAELTHANYPHDPGRLYDCVACESACHCVAGETECVYDGRHNGLAVDAYDPETAVTVHSVTRSAGIAGQYSLTSVVEYPGEGRSSVVFVGSTYGGPIVMRTESGMEVFVSSDVLDRIGRTLTPAWVRAFFGGAA